MATTSNVPPHGTSAALERPALTTSVAAELARQNMAVLTDSLALVLRASATIQQAQITMSQRAALLHQQAADNLRKASNPIDLVQIQSTLVLYEWQETLRYMQQLMLAGGKAGSQALGVAQEVQQTTAASVPAAVGLAAVA